MTLQGLHNVTYTTTRVLGRGGEGIVYELTDGKLVLKHYNEPLKAEKAAKLLMMAELYDAAIGTYAAWPQDVVRDAQGHICGFVMKKLTGYVPLHLLFSPMDRKRRFPDKGYNFLVHVARNLAIAFHKLHTAGLIIGDVNEGNILVNEQGMIAFIDCDSFQVKGPDGYYFCDVGVPRYTAPELLREKTFEQVVRTVDTDSFSLAVLLFQLLFLGRHPFAGTHKMAGDFPEEVAILKKEFAYSLENKRKKLAPPRDSLPLESLSDELVRLFHQAFEQEQRPAPADWARALEQQLLDMKTCPATSIHSYPAKLPACPWCDFQARKGILYFLDDHYLRSAPLIADVEQFVQGFNVANLELTKWEDRTDYAQIAPEPVALQFRRYRNLKWGSVCISVLAGIGGLTFHTDLIFTAVSIITSLILYIFSPWTVWLSKEMDRLIAVRNQWEARRDQLIAEYNHPGDLAVWEASRQKLFKYISDFRRLPEEYERRRKLGEENIYDAQLEAYLSAFQIEAHNIPAIGFTRKSALADQGILTAADIGRLPQIRVPGIGPKNIQILMDWRRQMATGFVFVPDPDKTALVQQEATREIGAIRNTLEQLIRKEYQSLTYQRINLTNRAAVLAPQIEEACAKAWKAHLEEQQFRKMAA